MNQCSRLLLAVSLCLTVACGSKSNMKGEDANKSDQELYTVIEQGDMSNHNTQEVIVIISMEELNEVYAEINSTRRPGLPIPKIDFDNYTVVAAFAGTKSNGGYSVIIDTSETDDTLHFACSLKSPDPMQPVTMAITTPFMLVKALKADKKITASF